MKMVFTKSLILLFVGIAGCCYSQNEICCPPNPEMLTGTIHPNVNEYVQDYHPNQFPSERVVDNINCMQQPPSESCYQGYSVQGMTAPQGSFQDYSSNQFVETPIDNMGYMQLPSDGQFTQSYPVQENMPPQGSFQNYPANQYPQPPIDMNNGQPVPCGQFCQSCPVQGNMNSQGPILSNGMVLSDGYAPTQGYVESGCYGPPQGPMPCGGYSPYPGYVTPGQVQQKQPQSPQQQYMSINGCNSNEGMPPIIDSGIEKCHECYCICSREEPFWYNSWQCDLEPVTICRKCCRWVPEMRQERRCRWVPEYYYVNVCHYKKEYYTRPECKMVSKYRCVPKCRPVRKYFCKKMDCPSP
jgi:hypothetical protein